MRDEEEGYVKIVHTRISREERRKKKERERKKEKEKSRMVPLLRDRKTDPTTILTALLPHLTEAKPLVRSLSLARFFFLLLLSILFLWHQHIINVILRFFFFLSLLF